MIFKYLAKETFSMRYPITCSLYCTSRCDNKCKHCLVRSAKPGDAEYGDVLKNLKEFKKLGGVYVDLTGGNPLMVPWLPQILRDCQSLNLYSSLTVSGPKITSRDKEVFEYPSILRFSVDGNEKFHNENRGKNYFSYIREGLKIAREVRNSRKTQLIFTVIPGKDGNISKDHFIPVLKMAREFKVLVNVNPLFNIKNLSKEELKELQWFARQADVQLSRGKLRFMLEGGNNRQNSACNAIRSVVTISADNKLVLPCYHHSKKEIPLENGLKTALDSRARERLLDRDGQFKACQGCSIWCYVVPSWVNHPFDRIVVWEHARSGFQRLRDSLLREAGKFHPVHPYPDLRYQSGEIE